MSYPQPVDLNALSGVLSKAKKVIKMVENDDVKTYKGGNRQNFNDYEDTPTQVKTTQKSITPTKTQIETSKLPSNIKKMMLETPLPTPPPTPSLKLEDYGDDYYEKPIDYSNKNAYSFNKIKNNDNNNNNGVNIEDLKETIKDVLIEYLSNEYTKKITENVVKQTITTLIREGKISKKIV